MWPLFKSWKTGCSYRSLLVMRVVVIYKVSGWDNDPVQQEELSNLSPQSYGEAQCLVETREYARWMEVNPADRRKTNLFPDLEMGLTATPFNNLLPNFGCPFAHPRAVASDAWAVNWSRWKKIFLSPFSSQKGSSVKRYSREWWFSFWEITLSFFFHSIKKSWSPF